MEELEHLTKQSMDALFTFLNVEADLGKTHSLLATMHLDKGNTEGYEASKRNAIKALETIDGFMDRLASDTKPQIEARRSELAQMISTLP